MTRTEKVQRNWVRNKFRVIGEVRVGTWLSSTHVVSSSSLREPFQESNEENDLPLGGVTESIPLLRWRASIRWERSAIGRDWPWEVDAIGLDNVTNKGSHGHATVLDLGVTQESNGLFIGVTPDGDGGKLKRIVVLE